MNWHDTKIILARSLRDFAGQIEQAQTKEMLMKDYGKAIAGLASVIADQDQKLTAKDKQIADLTAARDAAVLAAPDAEDAGELTAAGAVIAAHPVAAAEQK